MFSFVRGIFLLCLLVSHSSLLIGVKGATCSAGEGLLPFFQKEGKLGYCNKYITDENECKSLAQVDGRAKGGYAGTVKYSSMVAPGCIFYTKTNWH